MDDKKPAPGAFQIPIHASDDVQAGAFSNVARISHTPESFQIDFLVVHAAPPYARLQSRILLTPGHAKRLIRALEENLQRYEGAHGPILMQEAPLPPDGYLQ